MTPETTKENNADSFQTSVALTGGAGFVGSAILRQLLEAGVSVKALQRHTKLPEHKNLTIVGGSLSDPSSLAELVKGAQCVIHCGGAVSARNAAGFFESNEKGTANLVKAAKHEGVARLLYISSMAAREPEISPYAASKRAGEEIVKTSAIKAWDIIRPPAIYGPGDQQMLPLLRLLQSRIGILPGGRQARVSVVYVDDLARAVCCWFSLGGAKGSIYEIDDGHENGYTWQNLLDKAAEIMNISIYYITPPYFLMRMAGYMLKIIGRITGKTPFLTPDKLRELSHLDWVRCDKGSIEKDLNWTAQTDFKTGIAQTLRWYQCEGLLRGSKLEKMR